ncbi:expansin EXLX1 family cellulose-binding protein [Lonsdalea quercina]|uniref:expansin EXLX1 family cellulose-binding protein n=1 Tax=Lonsdalea quercina TaxID=71657 RepID=UPI0039765AFA
MKIKTPLLIPLLISLSSTAFNNAHASWGINDVCQGYATATGSGYSGGALLLDPISSDMEITALNGNQLNYNSINAAMAGAYLKVTGPKGSTTVYVTDIYPEGGDCALDLSYNAFQKIGDVQDGIINIEWQLVEAPVSGNVIYRIKDGSNPYWAAVQVRNAKYPIIAMQYMKDNSWVTAPKMNYNHFILENLGNKVTKIKFTDIKGRQLEDVLPQMPESTSQAYMVIGNVQLP